MLVGDAKEGGPVVFGAFFAEQDGLSLQSSRVSINNNNNNSTMEPPPTCCWVHPRSPAPLPSLVMTLPAGTGHDAG